MTDNTLIRRTNDESAAAEIFPLGGVGCAKQGRAAQRDG